MNTNTNFKFIKNLILGLALLTCAISLHAYPREMGKAIKDGDMSAFREALSQMSHPDEEGRGGTAMMLAANHGKVEMMKALKEAGADVNFVAKREHRAIINAARQGQYEATAWLLEQGADPNVSNYNGWTPILTSLFWEHPEVAELLLKQNLSKKIINTPNQYGFTPLIAASRKGYTEMVRTLIEQDAYVNYGPRWTSEEADEGVARQFPTALTQAARRGYTEIVTLLLENGANIYQLDGRKLSPYKAAKKGKHKHIIAMLYAEHEKLDNGFSERKLKKGTKLKFRMPLYE